MVDTFTPELRIRLPEVGAKDDLWAPPVTDGLNDGVVDMLDESLTEKVNVNLDPGDVTLTKSDGVTDNHRPMHLNAIGANATPRTIFVPDPPTSKLYYFTNGRTTDTTFSTVSGVGVVIPSGTDRLVWVDVSNDETEIVDFQGNIVTFFQQSGSFETLLLDIENASAGDTQVTAFYIVQGNAVHVNIPTFSSTITPGGNWNRVRLLPNTPASISDIIGASAFHQLWYGYALVNGVSTQFATAGPREIGFDFFDIQLADPVPFLANNDVLTMPYRMTLTYFR